MEHIPTDSAPLFAVPAPEPVVLAGPLSENIEAALRLWLGGLTQQQADAGLGSLPHRGWDDVTVDVTVDGGEVHADFNQALAEAGWGGSTAAIRFLSELQGQVFQFEDAQELHLTVDGSCIEFWMLAESDCMTITRADMTR